MTSYYVSTPRWTVRVDVSPDGLILPSSARYIHAAYGQAFLAWGQALRRWHGAALRVVKLGEGRG